MRQAWYTTVVLMIAYTFSFLDRQVLNLMVGPIKLDYGISDTQFAILTGGAFGIFYTLMGLPMGWLADRYPRKWIISCGIAIWSLMTAACGATRTYPGLLLARVGVGVGEATLSPSAYSMLSDLFDRTRLPRAAHEPLCGRHLYWRRACHDPWRDRGHSYCENASRGNSRARRCDLVAHCLFRGGPTRAAGRSVGRHAGRTAAQNHCRRGGPSDEPRIFNPTDLALSICLSADVDCFVHRFRVACRDELYGRLVSGAIHTDLALECETYRIRQRCCITDRGAAWHAYGRVVVRTDA